MSNCVTLRGVSPSKFFRRHSKISGHRIVDKHCCACRPTIRSIPRRKSVSTLLLKVTGYSKVKTPFSGVSTKNISVTLRGISILTGSVHLFCFLFPFSHKKLSQVFDSPRNCATHNFCKVTGYSKVKTPFSGVSTKNISVTLRGIEPRLQP